MTDGRGPLIKRSAVGTKIKLFRYVILILPHRHKYPKIVFVICTFLHKT